MALTAKQKAFVSAYIIHKNATRAAKEAGYSEKTAYAIGWENLRKPEILEEIEKLFAEQAMTSSEALALMAEHARGNLADFIGLSEDEVSVHPNARLLKKYKRTRRTERGSGDEPGDVIDTIELELYDAQSALKEILDRTLGRPPQRTELTGANGKDLVFEFAVATRSEDRDDDAYEDDDDGDD